MARLCHAEEVVTQAEVCRWAEGELLVVNSPVLQSEIGEALYKRAPKPLRAAAVWYEDAEGTTVSLRSVENGADCAAMAKTRGGGGHARAAGFKVPHRGPWRWSARLDRNVHRDDASEWRSDHKSRVALIAAEKIIDHLWSRFAVAKLEGLEHEEQRQAVAHLILDEAEGRA